MDKFDNNLLKPGVLLLNNSIKLTKTKKSLQTQLKVKQEVHVFYIHNYIKTKIFYNTKTTLTTNMFAL